MKCPICNYEHGDIKGSEGGFYTLPINMLRIEHYENVSKIVYACPSCRQIFMEE